jgi:translation initiation factor IF-3
VLRFLDEGDKVKATIFFRGREMTRTNLGRGILERLIKDVEPQSIVEFRPRQEGNTLHAILAPKKSAVEREKEREKEAKQKAKAERKATQEKEKAAPGSDGAAGAGPDAGPEAGAEKEKQPEAGAAAVAPDAASQAS